MKSSDHARGPHASASPGQKLGRRVAASSDILRPFRHVDHAATDRVATFQEMSA
jgi:hypothetical protein